MSYKVAFITGGASGLGEAVVRKLHDNGYSVAIVDLDEERGRNLEKELPRTVFIKCDVTSEASVEDAVNQTIKKFGPLHVVVNSAGIFHGGEMVNSNGVIESSILQTYLQVNVIGTFNVCKFAAQKMIGQSTVSDRLGRGVIINIGSIAGIEGTPRVVVYGASKGAVNAMTLPMARDLGRHQIRVNCIAPSIIRTPMTSPIDNSLLERYQQQIALGRLGFADEFADCAYGIINSTYVNGAVIRLDGGQRLQNL
jgi:NAD(P)-dependent dehydrogenase (short-subunit alcohol dehydrogenase family)